MNKKFIKLTRYDNGKEAYIEAENIKGIYRSPANTFTIVTTNDAIEMISVTETPAEVNALIRGDENERLD